MRVRALANGNVLELDDEVAARLIDAGIYEAVGGEEPPAAVGVSAPKKTKSAKSLAQ